MTKLSEANNKIFSFLYCPGEIASNYYTQGVKLDCPDDIETNDYNTILNFEWSTYFYTFEEFVLELANEVDNDKVLDSQYLEYLEYLEISHRDHFLINEPFSNNKNRFAHLSPLVTDILDDYSIEVCRFFYASRRLLKKLISVDAFKEHTLFKEVNKEDGTALLVIKGKKPKAKGFNGVLSDIFLKDGETVVNKIITHHGDFKARKKPEFWTNLLCHLHKGSLLKPNLQNKEIIAAINNTFNQDLKENNITNFSKFKEGNWTPSNRYDFSYL